MLAGTAMAASQHLTAVYPLHVAGMAVSAYAAVDALMLNLVVSVVGTVVTGPKAALGRDATIAEDYELG
jgi:hypothetical protein